MSAEKDERRKTVCGSNVADDLWDVFCPFSTDLYQFILAMPVYQFLWPLAFPDVSQACIALSLGLES